MILGLDLETGEILAETWVDDYLIGFTGDGFLTLVGDYDQHPPTDTAPRR